MAGDADPKDIESEIEVTRDRLAHTIDELLYRAKPSTITERQKNKTKAYFVDEQTGEPRQDNILKVAGAVAGVVVVLVVIRAISRRSGS